MLRPWPTPTRFPQGFRRWCRRWKRPGTHVSSGQRCLNPLSQSQIHTEDLDLVQRVLAQDGEALEAFVARMRCVGSILKVRNARFGRPLDSAALDDMVQDTLVVIWRRLPSYAGTGPLEAWAYRIASYELLSGLRKLRKLPMTESAMGAEFSDVSAEESAPVVEPQGLSGKLLRHLQGREEQIVRLKHVEELSFDEIAGVLEVTPSTVKTHYYRAVKKLREIFRPMAGELGA